MKLRDGHWLTLIPADNLLSILMVVFEFSSAILVSVRYLQVYKERSSQSDDIKKTFWGITFQQGAFECSFVYR